MSVTEELNELIAQYDGSARDALNHTLAHLQAANAEIRDLKAQLAAALARSDEMSARDTAEFIALRAEIMRLKGEHLASEPPENHRDILALVDGEWVLAWYGEKSRGYFIDDVEGTIQPTAWKELE